MPKSFNIFLDEVLLLVALHILVGGLRFDRYFLQPRSTNSTNFEWHCDKRNKTEAKSDNFFLNIETYLNCIQESTSQMSGAD